jgi:glutathione S-transferase
LPWIRNSAPGLKGRAIAGPHDYEQIPELAERSKLRVKNFFADFNDRLGAAPFVAGERFSVAESTQAAPRTKVAARPGSLHTQQGASGCSIRAPSSSGGRHYVVAFAT